MLSLHCVGIVPMFDLHYVGPHGPMIPFKCRVGQFMHGAFYFRNSPYTLHFNPSLQGALSTPHQARLSTSLGPKMIK